MRLLSAQDVAQYLGDASKTSNGFKCRCPAHDDSNASLSIFPKGHGKKGWAVKCHVGCEPKDVYKALEAADIGFSDNQLEDGQSKKKSYSIVPAPIEWQDIKHYNYGFPTTHWKYHTADGRLAFVVCRWDTVDGKIIRPASVYQDKTAQYRWQWKLQFKPSQKSPLYNLPAIVNNPDAPIMVVEGEKTADKAQHIFPQYTVTTTRGGASNFRHTDLGPLKGREILLWPDNDATGRSSMKDFGQHIQAGNFCTDVQVASLPPGLPPKWDLADKLPEGVSLDDVTWKEAYKPDRDTVLSMIDPANYADIFNDLYYVQEDSNGHLYTISKELISRHRGVPTSEFRRNKICPTHEATKRCYIFVEGVRQDALLYWAGSIPHTARLNGYCFKPGIEPGVVNTFEGNKLNIWNDWSVQRSEGDFPLIHDYFLNVVCSNDKHAYAYLLNYLSSMIQAPDVKCEVMLLLRGDYGTGKSTMGIIMKEMLGRYFGSYSTIYPALDKFNHSFFVGKLMAFIEEFHMTESANMYNKFKSMVTDPTARAERKYMDNVEVENLIRIVGCSNHEHAVTVDTNDRRVSVFNINGDKMQDRAYFGRLRQAIPKEIPTFFNFLMNYPVDLSWSNTVYENAARKEQQFLRADFYKDMAYTVLKRARFGVKVFDEQRNTIMSMMEPDNWDSNEAKISWKITQEWLEQSLKSNSDRRKYEIGPSQIKVAKFIEWFLPKDTGHRDKGIKTSGKIVRNMDGSMVFDNLSRIPQLKEARKNFAIHAGLPYDTLFDDDTGNVVSLDKPEDLPF